MKKYRVMAFLDENMLFFSTLLRKSTLVIPDKLFLSMKYRIHMGKYIDWKNPKTFNEKQQWLKVFWRNDLGTICADKYKVRGFVKDRIGEKYLVKLYGVYKDVKKIEFDLLPDSIVLKANHGSGMNILVPNKNALKKGDIKKIKKKLKNWLKTDYYSGNREWVYKEIPRRIIIEEYLGKNILDFKLYCFNGTPKYWFVATDRDTEVKANFYNLDWSSAGFGWIYPSLNRDVKIPINSLKMIELASKLSKGFPFVRVDFYEINEEIYFGEMTFFHGSGLGDYHPNEFNYILGDLLILDNKK